MESLADAIREVASERRTLRIYTADPDRELAARFATRNVVVEHVSLPDVEEGFVVVEDPGGFAGALAVSTFEELLAPPIGLPWEDVPDRAHYRELLQLLQDTAFASLDRRQLLATSREIEERAWRVGGGRLAVGFQRRDAYRAQAEVFRRLAVERGVDVHLYLPSSWAPETAAAATVHRSDADELGAVWFLVFDGGGEGQECALLAEERAAGEYYGFWTYDPGTVADLLDYLDRTY
jgi:hypothetical protein